MPPAVPPVRGALEMISASLPTPLQEALLHACLAPPDEVTAHWQRWRAEADIDHLDDAANRLLPLLYRQLEAVHLDDPEVPRLRGIYRYHWCRNQLLLAELRELLAALHGAGIEVMLLKGAALIERYYRDPGLRPMSDLDLMVPLAAMDAACAVLTRLGWTPKLPTDLHAIRTWRTTHALDFTRERNGRISEVDLHWTPLPRATWPDAEAPFWARAQRTQVHGTPVYLLDPTDQLLHACLHGGPWNAMPPYRWVADAIWILRADGERIDWQRLLGEARRLNAFTMLQATLGYLHASFRVSIPPPVIDRLRRSRPSPYEMLEFRMQTREIAGLRVDQLLLLEWFNHSRAFRDTGTLKRLAAFPRYLLQTWKLARWSQVPGFVLTRLAVRSGLRRDPADGGTDPAR